MIALRVLYTVVLLFAERTNEIPGDQRWWPGPPHGFFHTLHAWLIDPWMARDAGYYAMIVRDGYSVEAGTAVFHPLYPLTSWFAALPFGQASVGLWIVSTLSAIALTVAVARYTAEVHGERWANVAAGALLCMPVGFVWLLLYTEGLFTALVVASLWSLHRTRWGPAAVFAILATLTRQQGLLLAAPFVIVAWRSDSRLQGLLAAAAPVLAYAGFAVYRFVVLRDVDLSAISSLDELAQALLVSPAAQEIAHGQRIALPWEPLLGQLNALASGGEAHLLLDLVLGLGIIAAVLGQWKRLTVAELWYCLGTAGVSLCYYNGAIAPYMALPRHAIILFPVGLLIARYLDGKNNPNYFKMAAVAGITFNCLLAYLYGSLRWIP